jgi:hypothetical protein
MSQNVRRADGQRTSLTAGGMAWREFASRTRRVMGAAVVRDRPAYVRWDSTDFLAGSEAHP